eukprot:scaffold12086_cov67-Phaeocystis_antarctica.AAC.17
MWKSRGRAVDLEAQPSCHQEVEVGRHVERLDAHRVKEGLQVGSKPVQISGVALVCRDEDRAHHRWHLRTAWRAVAPHRVASAQVEADEGRASKQSLADGFTARLDLRRAGRPWQVHASDPEDCAQLLSCVLHLLKLSGDTAAAPLSHLQQFERAVRYGVRPKLRKHLRRRHRIARYRPSVHWAAYRHRFPQPLPAVAQA